MNRPAMDRLRPWRLYMGPLLALLLATGLLAGCGGEATQDELHGHFGPGAGGTALSTTPGDFQTIDITKSNGDIVGAADFDSSVFVAQGSTSDGEFNTLVNAADNQTVSLLRITGRMDTPCRFQAAVLARDDGYKILKSGPRRNDHGLDFYQVNVRNGVTHVSLFCTTLHDDVGAIVIVTAADNAPVDTLQVHFILNSIRKS